jgi:hypothetical protein
MFEKQVKEISRKIGEERLESYSILTYKKHQRDIYFQNSKQAIYFIKPRLNSFKKKIIYLLLKIGLLQLFLKRIYLSYKFGDVIYVGNQIKGFNLKKKTVLSFPLEYKGMEKNFLKLKRFQKKISFRGFTPEIFELNDEIPYSKEEILGGGDVDYLLIFKRLLEFYNFMEIKKTPIKKYVSNLRKKTKDKFLREKLDILSKKNFMVFTTTLHGDLAKENILIKNGKIVFIDWNPYNGPMTDDLVSLLKKRISKKEFMSILEFYPKEVKINLDSYLMLSRISLKINKS